jgi:hypothetical protein
MIMRSPLGRDVVVRDSIARRIEEVPIREESSGGAHCERLARGIHGNGHHVRGPTDAGIAGRLLGAHVMRCAQRETGLGEAAAPTGAHGERDAEVGHDGLAGLKQNVRGLDVAMDHALGVSVVQGLRDVGRDADSLVDRKLSLSIEPLAEALAFHVEYVEEHAVRGTRIELRQDVRVRGWRSCGSR